MDDEESFDAFEDSKERMKAKQKAYRRKIYLEQKAKKKEYALKDRQNKKAKKALDYEETLRKKNASLWESLRPGSKLDAPEPEQVAPKAKNPFLDTDAD